ncbi:exosortase family protein XrtF [Chryseobacterium defluvii]|uniref:Exosortase family protein XrtF n=1 Tax=Chryseobacterium defluvii TaxID=160396 RepID=A0A840KCU8_9FLAO|nr:exosortase family protein XrtF [Chryseobacterium defluvii]MBB4807309.1 exosortase family protein XrtF [Chryseobacterium defluvii]
MLKDFKPTLIILIRFIFIYLFLLGIYQSYLNYFTSTGLDPYSRWVASQSAKIQDFFSYTTTLVDYPQHETVCFNIRNQCISRMVEGCNSISVMILFISFVSAFYKGFKTIIFILIGIVFLHIMNVLRIVGLNIILVDYKSFSKICHDYFFPAVIYGSVVLLWLIWIKFFALKKDNKE